MMNPFSLTPNLSIDFGTKTYFIAEIGSNFDGSKSKAIDLINLAAESGSDAVKFQNYTADTLVSDVMFDSLVNHSHQSNWRDSVWQTYKNAELPVEWMQELSEEARRLNIDFFSAPYDYSLAVNINPFVCAHKIGSGDINHHEFIRNVARLGRPVMLSTGASTMEEVRAAVEVLSSASSHPIVLMQCNTNYTNSDLASFMNLNVVKKYNECFPGAVIGFSDHSTSETAVLAAVSLGARVIERHFSDDPSNAGPDHPFSTDPEAMSSLISKVRELEIMLGDASKKVECNEVNARVVQRRSACAAYDLKDKHLIQPEDIVFLRPAPDGSISPPEAKVLHGCRLTRALRRGECFFWDDVVAGDY